MTDDTPTPGEEQRRRPSPTSRARRIGGRPLPQPTPTGPQPGGTSAPPAEPPARPARPTPPRGDPPAPAPARRPSAAVLPEPSATAPEPSATAPEAASAPRGRGGFARWIPAVILGAAAIALAVVLVFASRGVYWGDTGNSATSRAAKQEQVLAAAKKCFATVNTYDYRKLSGLLAKDLPCTTGGFRTDLKTALQKTILPQAPKQKAVQTAQVNKAGIISVTPDGKQWTTLIYGQLQVTNSTTAKGAPRTDLVGAVVTMNQVGGQYLISKVDFDAGNGLGS